SLRTWLPSHISVASWRLAAGGGEEAEPRKLESMVLSLPGGEDEAPKKLESRVFITPETSPLTKPDSSVCIIPDAALPRKLKSMVAAPISLTVNSRPQEGQLGGDTSLSSNV